jgi:hypothetical protein
LEIFKSSGKASLKILAIVAAKYDSKKKTNKEPFYVRQAFHSPHMAVQNINTCPLED